MQKLEKTILSLNALCRPASARVSAAALLFVTLVFLVALLSVPLYAPQLIVWLAVYPVVQSEISGIGFGKVFMKSLWIIPFVALIGIFNPIVDTQPAFSVAGITVSRGWVSFVSILLRGIVALQAVIILSITAGFYDMCAALRKLGCPRVLVTQLQFTFRYIIVIAEEALAMDRARKARGFGRKSYPLAMWTRMTGQLLLRSHERARRVNLAMKARGFNGSMPVCASLGMTPASWGFAAVWCLLIIAVRFYRVILF